MSTVLTKVVSSIIVAGGIGFVATPIIYQKQINKAIQTQKTILAQQKIELSNTKNNDSFFNIKREYILTIKDITPIIRDIYPNIAIYKLQRMKKVFDNIQFLINLDFSKYPISHKDAIKISLYKLNKNTSDNLAKNYAGKELLSFIKNRGLEILLDTDALNISKATLKNIDLTLYKKQNSKNNVTIKTNNIYTMFGKKTSTNIGNITVNVNNNKTHTNFSFNNIMYNLSKQNDFNYKTAFSIENIAYALKSYSYYSKKTNEVNISINNISSNSNISSIVNKLNISNNVNIKDIKLSSKKDLIEFKNFTFNNKIEKLDLGSVKKIIELAQTSNNIKSSKVLPYVQSLINKGFNFKINPISLDKAIINIQNKKFDISKINLNLTTKLAKNDFKFNSNPKILLNSLSANLNIITTKNNINLLTQINPMAAIYLAMVTTQTKNEVKINISYKNGKLTSNGKKLF